MEGGDSNLKTPQQSEKGEIQEETGYKRRSND